MNGRLLTVGFLAFGLILAGMAARNAALALMALPFLAYLLAAVLSSPRAEALALTAERSVQTHPAETHPAETRPAEVRPAEKGALVSVTVSVRNNGWRVGPLLVSEATQPGMTIAEGRPWRWGDLAAGESMSLSYSFRAERGTFRWETVQVIARDPFGLFESRCQVAATGQVLVRPRPRKYRPFPLRPDSTLHSPGSIPADRGGSGTDFWGVREYQPGDPLRRLDWRRTARHPRRFFTRELEVEEIADIGLILDARGRGNVVAAGGSIVEHELAATASLAELFLRRGNRAGLIVLGETTTVVYPGYGRLQLNRILAALADVRPDAASSSGSLERVPLRVFGSRALIIILSPLSTHDWQIFPRLRARGNEGLLISADPVRFALGDEGSAGAAPGDLPARVKAIAVRAALVERRLELRRIARLGVRVIDWQVSQPLAPLVRNALRASRGESR